MESLFVTIANIGQWLHKSDSKSAEFIPENRNHLSSDSPGGNISQNFSKIIFDFVIFQFSEKFWEIFQISLESSRLSSKITE